VQSAGSPAGVTPDLNAAQDLTAHAQQAMQMLQGMNGADLDRAFLNNMVQDHQMVIGETQGAIPQAQNAQVRTLLESTIPVVRAHLNRAQALQGGAGGQHNMGVHKDSGR
jgi:putative membrane protein